MERHANKKQREKVCQISTCRFWEKQHHELDHRYLTTSNNSEQYPTNLRLTLSPMKRFLSSTYLRQVKKIDPCYHLQPVCRHFTSSDLISNIDEVVGLEFSYNSEMMRLGPTCVGLANRIFQQDTYVLLNKPNLWKTNFSTSSA